MAMAFADIAVMETVRLLDKVRADGPKGKPEIISQEPLQFKPVHKVKSKEPKQPKTDPLRVLDPGRKKLTTVESQRVLAVLDDSIKRIEVVTLLPYVTENLERFTAVLGAELVTAIQEHTDMKNSYNDTYNQLMELNNPERLLTSQSSKRSLASSQRSAEEVSRSSSRHSSGLENEKNEEIEDMERLISEEEEQLLETFHVLKKQMGFSTRNILRLLSLNPAAVNTVRAERQSRDQESSNLITYMNELRGFILERLLTTPLEEKEKTDYLMHITIRERKNSQIIKKLSSELQAAEEEKDAEISKRNEEIRRLKADLNQIEKFSEEHIRRTKSESEKQQQADTKNSEGKQGKLQADLQGLKTQLATNTTEHRESELALRKRKYKIETEVENWIQKFDTDMGERQDEYEDLDTVYTEEKAQLNELEERFTTLETEYVTIMEEKKIAQEKKEREERELALMIKGATVIQAFWRSYKCRKALKSKKKKGKKGKKGKGKGKGKKK